MHKTYFLFEYQVDFLKKELIGACCHDIFTYQKNELVITFPEHHLNINIGREFPSILLKKASPVKKPKYHLFKKLAGHTLQKIIIKPFDKNVTLDFGKYKLAAIFYGKYPNVILNDSDSQSLDQFKDSPEAGNAFKEPRGIYDPRKLERETFYSILSAEPGQTIEYLILRHMGGMNKRMITELCARCSVDGRQEIGMLEQEVTECLWREFKRMADALRSPQTLHLYYPEDGSQILSLFPLEHLPSDCRVVSHESVNDAWIRFIEDYQGQNAFRDLYSRCRQALNKRLRFIEKTLSRIEDAEDFSRKKEQAEVKGNLLLTFKNSIPPGTPRITLQNIFSDTLENVEIDLDSRKSVVENAQIYFSKYKNIDEQRYILMTKKNGYLDEHDTVRKLQDKLTGITKLSELRKLYTTLVDMKMIQEQNLRKPTKTSLKYSFNRLIIDREWDLFIGKNGENNDLLTFSFANNWDIWLHAQGVTGAHVVLHLPSKEINPPHDVLLKAAQVAAANSRSRHSDTVPVVYTRIKHVHRIRKAPPGTVRITNEEVVFVHPLDVS